MTNNTGNFAKTKRYSMRNYIPNTKKEQEEMLKSMGLASVDELFADIPQKIKLNRKLNLAKAMSEPELYSYMKALAKKNISSDTHICFMGGGVYDHFIPAVVWQTVGRQEFYTAYTPYQAEMSQGTLQAIFEYQSMICRLTGMDVSNASVYDAGTACAEAMLMAKNITGKTEVIIAGKVNPQYVQVCKTYAKYNGINITAAPLDTKKGTVSLPDLKNAISDNCAAVIVQSPNFLGLIEELEETGKIVKEKGAMFIVSVDPVSLGILEPPALFGADIVVGEGQALGNPMNFGGPGFGFFTCKTDYMRKMPGRIVGETTDLNGKRGFVLTLQAREQHIRREKATSNICSNQALCSLAATVYMSIMGEEGIKKAASLCAQKSHYMYDRLIQTGKFEPKFRAPFFKEFVLTYKGKDLNSFKNSMIQAGFMPGIDLDSEGLGSCILIAVTEKRTKEEIDAYVKKAGELL